jgi:hypothetical protein
MIRIDDRLLDSPLVPVCCSHCGAKVLARKASWQQTSVQWDTEATARCLERRDWRAASQQTCGLFLVCSKLRDSVEDAAHSGAIPILDEAGVVSCRSQ